MAAGFSSNFQDKIPLQHEICAAQVGRSFESFNESRHSDEPIILLCEWNIPRGSVQIFNGENQPREELTQSSVLNPTSGSSCRNRNRSYSYKIIGSSLDEPRERHRRRDGDHLEIIESSPVTSEIDAVARHAGHDNEGNLKLALQTGGTSNFNWNEGNERPSSLENMNKSSDTQSRNLGRRRVTSMFGPGSVAPDCKHEQSERTSTCAVDGAGFCLGNLAMINHCTQFGGGPGIDRDGEQVSGKFCGVGARYRVSKNLNSVDLKETPRTVDRTSPEILSQSITIVEDEIFKTEAVATEMIYLLVAEGLSKMIAALAIVKKLLLPRVPGLTGKVKNTWVEFVDNVKEVNKSKSLIENLSLFKRSTVKVLLEFDLKVFLGILSLSDEEASTFLQNSLTEWNTVLKNFVTTFLPSSRIRA